MTYRVSLLSYMMSKNVSLELVSRPTFEPLSPGELPEGHLAKLYRFGHL